VDRFGLYRHGVTTPASAPIHSRVPACALHVAQMLEQHRQVTQRLENIEPLRLRWVETADADVGRELAERYEDLKAVLNVHLRREVTEVMPVVDRVPTEKEMPEAGKQGIDQLDKKFLVGYLGMVLSTNPPQDQKEMFKEIPARSDSATASWAAGCTGNSKRHSSRDARFPKRCSLRGCSPTVGKSRLP